MILFLCKKRRAAHRGFSMVELAIVLGVFGILAGAIWALAGQARQKAHLNDAIQAAITIADGTRAAYMAQASVSENYPTLTPELIKDEVFPSNLVHNTTTTCSGTTGYYADTPWQSSGSACGSLNVCRMNYPTNTTCDSASNAAIAVQYFGISFDSLDYPSCVALASGLTPAQIPGLIDVSVGTTGNPGVYNGAVMPASVPWAQTHCTPGSYANLVVFIVTLRAPST